MNLYTDIVTATVEMRAAQKAYYAIRARKDRTRSEETDALVRAKVSEKRVDALLARLDNELFAASKQMEIGL